MAACWPAACQEHCWRRCCLLTVLLGTKSSIWAATVTRACRCSSPHPLHHASWFVFCADVELLLGSSGDFSSVEASTVCGAGSSSDSCCSDEPRPSSPGGSLTQFTSSTADLTSLSSFCLREPHQCLTADGWKLHIMHVFDPTAEPASTSGRSDSNSSSGGSSRRPQHPVLLIPGLASSGEHTFDLLPEHSLVNALVARGYDVWMADLRGGCWVFYQA